MALDAELIELPPPAGSWLATLELYRLPGGAIAARLIDMPSFVVDDLPGEPADKLAAVADWLVPGADSLREQAMSLRVDADSPTP